jgi:hypothetical protein
MSAFRLNGVASRLGDEPSSYQTSTSNNRHQRGIIGFRDSINTIGQDSSSQEDMTTSTKHGPDPDPYGNCTVHDIHIAGIVAAQKNQFGTDPSTNTSLGVFQAPYSF